MITLCNNKITHECLTKILIPIPSMTDYFLALKGTWILNKEIEAIPKYALKNNSSKSLSAIPSSFIKGRFRFKPWISRK